MNSLLIQGGEIVSAVADDIKTGDILLQNGIIARVGEVRLQGSAMETIDTIDATGLYVSSGFIDLQTNGGGGYNFGDAAPAEIHKIITFHTNHGTTGLLPTTVTAPIEQIKATIGRVRKLNHPAVLGMHIEGPFITKEHKGAQNAHYILTSTVEQFAELAKGDEGFIKIVTLAPELPGADRLIARIREIGAIPSLGHSAATYEQALTAIDQGIGLFTHLFNAMRGLHHREPGALGAALDSDVMVELIADGVHVHPMLIRLLRKTKGIEQICLVTDSISAAGLTDGQYSLGGLAVFVKNGEARLADGTLAGSTLTMEHAVKNFIEFTGCSVVDGVKTATLNPAKLLKIDEKKGSLEEGKDADITIFDADFNIYYTIINGEIVYDRKRRGYERRV
ncbi:N-acetylglucosamine-6-phosphate deacetylase [Candidatus Acetothermia bacterium]|nr:N-acetylglucosamine-6-phosphate deacetylase [Candidatus Acetothermia bacterium]MCI2426870.1 N-acetylglucosamine-6-phosphate deacetylase [Candidatus Acetothermia bacterium]MCI2428788.1 N-acetylglucosamine-6-phosphate deacetylase [Candidatus Acetothermia bacterium]